jgi:hypothetical protein
MTLIIPDKGQRPVAFGNFNYCHVQMVTLIYKRL